MDRRIVAGNWKMNTTLREGVVLAEQLSQLVNRIPAGVEVIVAPPFTHLTEVRRALNPRIMLGAQDCSSRAQGAFTGDVSAEMLKDCGVEWVILGHSERRQYHGDDTPTLREKLGRATSVGLKPIFCVGEPENIRAQGQQNAWDWVAGQLKLLRGLGDSVLRELIVAYEPIWAIGTGKTATPEDAGWMCLRITRWLTSEIGEIGGMVPVLYGGSCNSANAKEIFSQPGVSGGLIGGASLKAEEFVSIACSF